MQLNPKIISSTFSNTILGNIPNSLFKQFACATLLLITASMSSATHAAAGDLDPSFNVGDVLVEDGTIASALAVDASDRILMTGRFSTINGESRQNIVRFNADGTVDTTFQATVFRATSLFSGILNKVVVQADGKILLGGAFDQVNGETRSFLTRLNSDGSTDTSFNPAVNSSVNAIALQSDDKILIGGSFSQVNGQSRSSIARLLPDGSLDATYNPVSNSAVLDIQIEAGDSALIAGSFNTIGGVSRNRIARISSTGVVDSMFNPNANNSVTRVAVQTAGTGVCAECKIVISGSFTQLGSTARSRLARVDAVTGAVDSDYNPSPSSNVRDIKILSNDQLVLVGDFSTVAGAARSRVALLDSAGAAEPAFDIAAGGSVTAIGLQSGNRVLVAGPRLMNNSVTQPRLLLARFSAAGALENLPNVTSARYVASEFTSAIQRTNGKIIVAGRFEQVAGIEAVGLVQIDETGAVDLEFNPQVGGRVKTIALQDDGKLLVGGDLTSVNGNPASSNIIRLEVDGSIDTTFTGEISNGAVNKILLDDDDKILAAGSFAMVNQNSVRRVTRLTTDGLTDNLFTADLVNDTVEDMVLQPDGKILIGGRFTQVNGNSHNRIARLQSAGAEDPSFTASADNIVRNITLQGGDKILIGGSFNTVNSISRSGFARLQLSDGSLDTGFNFNLGNFEAVEKVIVQPDDKLLLAGGFVNFGATNQQYQLRILSDGTDDPDYNSHFDRDVTDMLLLSSGKLLALGRFLIVDGSRQPSMVLLETGLPPLVEESELCVPVKTAAGAIAVVCL